MGKAQEHLGPIREALREFEEAVRNEARFSFDGKVVRRQELDRARTKVIEQVVEMVRKMERARAE